MLKATVRSPATPSHGSMGRLFPKATVVVRGAPQAQAAGFPSTSGGSPAISAYTTWAISLRVMTPSWFRSSTSNSKLVHPPPVLIVVVTGSFVDATRVPPWGTRPQNVEGLPTVCRVSGKMVRANPLLPIPGCCVSTSTDTPGVQDDEGPRRSLPGEPGRDVWRTGGDTPATAPPGSARFTGVHAALPLRPGPLSVGGQPDPDACHPRGAADADLTVRSMPSPCRFGAEVVPRPQAHCGKQAVLASSGRDPALGQAACRGAEAGRVATTGGPLTPATPLPRTAAAQPTCGAPTCATPPGAALLAWRLSTATPSSAPPCASPAAPTVPARPA